MIARIRSIPLNILISVVNLRPKHKKSISSKCYTTTLELRSGSKNVMYQLESDKHSSYQILWYEADFLIFKSHDNWPAQNCTHRAWNLTIPTLLNLWVHFCVAASKQLNAAPYLRQEAWGCHLYSGGEGNKNDTTMHSYLRAVHKPFYHRKKRPYQPCLLVKVRFRMCTSLTLRPMCACVQG